VVFALACLFAASAAPAQASEPVRGIARVQQDGSLAIGDSVVRLTGIFIPPRRDCRTNAARCAPRAVAALENRASASFVHSSIAGRRRDGSLDGFCSVDGRGVLDPRTDLGAWLVERGLALAGSGAPFDYSALERLAEAQGLGLWRRSPNDPRGLRR
jgi:endonuclease YncB( thermonuclease family)